ncbi:hypothetical protein AcW1_006638 [Taiwanofungus camphoratus]|nr:hypothetical protein AcV5_009226 [Antrodia cinnamomea]KAI0954106.1 hypothetical protein AcV7_007432 [Antrodia cinnamomea]KAI0954872.1 hypothetical protein AcW1_006638 [Antrodia cinnamomea]
MARTKSLTYRGRTLQELKEQGSGTFEGNCVLTGVRRKATKFKVPLGRRAPNCVTLETQNLGREDYVEYRGNGRYKVTSQTRSLMRECSRVLSGRQFSTDKERYLAEIAYLYKHIPRTLRDTKSAIALENLELKRELKERRLRPEEGSSQAADAAPPIADAGAPIDVDVDENPLLSPIRQPQSEAVVPVRAYPSPESNARRPLGHARAFGNPPSPSPHATTIVMDIDADLCEGDSHAQGAEDGVGKAQIAALKLQVAHLERQLAQARAHEESLEAQIVEMQSSTRVPMDQLENAEVAHAVCAKRIQELEEQVKKQTVLIESYVCQARAQLGMLEASVRNP